MAGSSFPLALWDMFGLVKLNDFWLLWSIVFLLRAIGLYTQIGVLLRGGQLEGRPVHSPNSLAAATMSFYFMMHIVSSNHACIFVSPDDDMPLVIKACSGFIPRA